MALGAVDGRGNRMDEPHVWTFATEDTLPFVVEGNSPEAGAVGVPTTATVEIAFNKALLAGSETTTAFLVQNLDDAMGQAYVPGQVTRLGNALRFTPDAPLDAGAVYQVYVAGATSFLGESQAGAYRWSFETLDAVPPQVVRTAPENGATDVARNGALTVFFDQALLVGGEGVTFEVTDPAGEPIVGHLAWVPGGEDLEADVGLNTEGSYQGYRGLRFQPSMPLLASTTYQVLVKDVQNLAGMLMETHTWSFTTEGGATIFNTPTPVVRHYYAFNGQRVALRETGLDGQDVLYWMMGDHLGTTSLVLNEDGTVHSEARHYPYGEERWRSGTLPMDVRFTGQKSQPTLGNVYHMGARFLDVYIARWLSADTLVPDPADPQSFNRYSWVAGNPLRFVDPTGHLFKDPMIEGTWGRNYRGPFPEIPEPSRYLASHHYGAFDKHHLRTGNPPAVLSQVKEAVEAGEMRQISIRQPIQGGMLEFEGNYQVHGGRISQDQANGVFLGIYQDWSQRFETFEGSLWFGVGNDTSYAVEDLPSHYVGAFAAMQGIEPVDVLHGYLGGVTNTAEEPSREIKNLEFTPLVPLSTNTWRRQSWPSEMDVTPIDDPSLWQPVSFSGRFFRFFESQGQASWGALP